MITYVEIHSTKDFDFTHYNICFRIAQHLLKYAPKDDLSKEYIIRINIEYRIKYHSVLDIYLS